MSSFEALPDLAWVSIMFDFPEVPLLCKEGLGEVEAWRKHLGLHSATCRHEHDSTPTLILPFTKGRALAGRHF